MSRDIWYWHSELKQTIERKMAEIIERHSTNRDALVNVEVRMVAERFGLEKEVREVQDKRARVSQLSTELEAAKREQEIAELGLQAAFIRASEENPFVSHTNALITLSSWASKHNMRLSAMQELMGEKDAEQYLNLENLRDNVMSRLTAATTSKGVMDVVREIMAQLGETLP